MDIKEIEEIQNEALKTKNNEELMSKYKNAITTYLNQNKAKNEIISTMIRGFDLDEASVFLEYTKKLNKQELQSVWKQIRDNKDINGNQNNKGIKLLCKLLCLSIKRQGATDAITGNIILKIVNMILDEKKPIGSEIYKPIIRDYFINEVISASVFPNWESIKVKGDIIISFIDIIKKSVFDNNDEKYKDFNQWLVYGIQCAEKRIDEEKIQAQIPQSMTDELIALANHYSVVEKKLKDSVYEISRLEKIISHQKNELEAIEIEKVSLLNEIESLKTDINNQKKNLEDAKNEIAERKSINDAFTAIKKNDEQGILNDIAEELKVIYGQIKRSETAEMSIELGEIYREMIKKVFKQLDNKGIRME